MNDDRAPLVSVIIPTYNRKSALKRCLSKLFAQDIPTYKFEIIVVDDGSTDGTGETIDGISSAGPVSVRYFRQDNRGPASARNIGIREASGGILLFLGDDIMASPGLISGHLSWHEKYSDPNVAVLGLITWSEDIRVTPFMYWLEHGGPQFGFQDLEGLTDADAARFFYSSNISVKKSFLIKNEGFFDEDFHHAAFEDLELGMRLKKAGLALKYNAAAAGYHEHFTSLASACRRMRTVGESGMILSGKIGKPIMVQKKPVWLSAASAARYAIYYAAGRICEYAFINDHVYRYLMDYCLRSGREKYLRNKR